MPKRQGAIQDSRRESGGGSARERAMVRIKVNVEKTDKWTNNPRVVYLEIVSSKSDPSCC